MPTNHDSVLSPYHPANNRRSSEGRGTYVYQPAISPFNLSLGWELEANHSAVRVPAGVDTISDGSVNGDSTEYVVLPAVTRSPRFVLGLLKDLVHSPSLNTDKSCGYHVHMGMQGATLPTLRRWAIATEALAKEIEDIAFKAVPDARQSNSYCRRIRLTEAGTRFESTKYNNSRRYHWLNTVEIFRPGGIRTIEVRLLGNTHRWKYLLAWSTFCMLLGREGWKIAHRPFESRQPSIKLLTDVLQAITSDVKLLDKRNEPIPTWVYSHLKSLGIEWSAFDRPLIALHNAEATLAGKAKKFYSDNQATEPNRSEDEDDNDDSCPCGCGEDGRCQSQMCDDGDCEPSECSYCHDTERCGGSPDCYNCRNSRHDEREWCGRQTCSTCERNEVGPYAPSEEPAETVRVEGTEPVTVAPTIHNSNVVIPQGSYTVTNRIGSQPLIVSAVQSAVNEIRNQNIDNINLAMNNAMMYGTSIARMVYDDSVNVGTGIDNAAYYAPTAAQVAESRAQELIANLPMSDGERTMSLDREAFRTNRGDR